MQAVMSEMIHSYNEGIFRVGREERPEPTAANGIINNEFILAERAGRWAHYGRNIFLLGPNLLEMLEQTDLGDLRIEDVRWPFPAFYISFGRAYDDALPGPPNRIDGAYFNNTFDDGWRIDITSRRLDHRPDRDNRWPFSRDLAYSLIVDSSQPLTSLTAALADAKRTAMSNIATTYDRDPAEVTAIGLEYGLNVRDSSWDSAHDRERYVEAAHASGARAAQVAIAGLCYLLTAPDIEDTYPIDAPPALLKGLQADRKSARQGAKRQLLEQGYHSIRLLEIPASRRAAGGNGSSGTLARKPHWRRGHFRSQAHGPERALRRIQWIRPTVVGGDQAGDGPARIYKR
jgi:hypothetical protein